MIINDDFRNYVSEDWCKAFIVSDPPYNQNYHYSEYRDSLNLDDYGQLLWRAFADKKAVVIHYPEETINLLSRILGECKQVVSWVYPSNTAKQHRLISWWNCKPDFTKENQPYKNPKDKRIAARIAEGKQARLYDWWEINQVKNVSKATNPHPCPIPYQVAARIIKITTEPGDLVIDPFAGSGTIIKAAIMLNRQGLGFEIDAAYASYANKSLEVV